MFGGVNSDADAYHTHGSLAKKDGSNIDETNRVSFNNVLRKTISTVTNYYVETGGSDSNDGLTIGTAFATPSKVFEKLNNTFVCNYVNINFGIGSFTIDTDVFAKYSTSIDINTTVNNRQFNIIGTMTQIHSGVVVTNIAGRANIRSFSGVTVADDALKGKFLKVGTEYFPIAGNTTTEIYVSMTAPAGTYSIFEAQTDLVFTKATFLRKKVDAIMCFKNLNLKFTTPNTILRPQNFGYLFDELNMYMAIGLGAQPFNEALRFVKCGFIRTGLSEVQFGAAINVTDCNFIDGMRLAKNSKKNKIIGGCIFHNNGLGEMIGNNIVSSESGSVLSFINTSGSYNGLFYNIGSCTQACLTLETKGNINFTQLGQTTYGTYTDKSFNVILKRYSELYPLDIVLPDQVQYPMVDFTQGRILMIEGISKSFNPVLSFETIAEINTLGGLYDFVSCTETGKIYKYVALGSAYTVDNDDVLATADGGDTRFVNTNKLGGKLIENTTIDANQKFLKVVDASEVSFAVPNGIYPSIYKFSAGGVLFQQLSATGFAQIKAANQAVEMTTLHVDDSSVTNFRVERNKAIFFPSDPLTSVGIEADADLSANYTDLSYVQKKFVDDSIAAIPINYVPDYTTRVINIGAAQEFADIAAAQVFIDANPQLMNITVVLAATYVGVDDDYLYISNRDQVNIQWFGKSTGVQGLNIRTCYVTTGAEEDLMEYCGLFFIQNLNVSNITVSDQLDIQNCLQIDISGFNGGLNGGTVRVDNCTIVKTDNTVSIEDTEINNSNIITLATLIDGMVFNVTGDCSVTSINTNCTLPSGVYFRKHPTTGIIGKCSVFTDLYSENNKITKIAEIPATAGALLQDVAGALPDGYITEGIIFKPTDPNLDFGTLDIKGYAGGSWFTMGTYTYQAGVTRYITKFFLLNFGANNSITKWQQMIGNYNNNEAISDIRLEATNFGGNGGLIEITSEKL
jgi:hypothetical protein